jgi:D-aminoacyl-tRNA deacylase
VTERTPSPDAQVGKDEAAMRAVCQRVSQARVTVHQEVVGEIGRGLLVLLGVARGDSPADADRLAAKVARLRIFGGDDGRFDRDVLEVGGAVLVVSQFTLIADTTKRKGNRPDFSRAAPRHQAEPLYEHFCEALRAHGLHVETGVFGARMAVALVNEGPVTITLET